jgi:hypothetical protein
MERSGILWKLYGLKQHHTRRIVSAAKTTIPEITVQRLDHQPTEFLSQYMTAIVHTNGTRRSRNPIFRISSDRPFQARFDSGYPAHMNAARVMKTPNITAKT